ncbi:hypothetical protein [Coleofasciculus sp.]|uniref:hypothetical protein n=1 Tax=Coleofasciculus sp. TaxID=3100458 RepID=UPI003A14CCE7
MPWHVCQSIVGAGLGTVGAGLGTVGAGLGTKVSYLPIKKQQNPPLVIIDKLNHNL